jgi:hypothetical protein
LTSQESYERLIGELPAGESAGVLAATQHVTALPIEQAFYQLEDPPIAVLPTRPVV